VLVNTGIAAGPPGSQFRPAGPPAPGGILVHSALEPRSVLEPQQGEGALS
jgi:hypothetical protein